MRVRSRGPLKTTQESNPSPFTPATQASRELLTYFLGIFFPWKLTACLSPVHFIQSYTEPWQPAIRTSLKSFVAIDIFDNVSSPLTQEACPRPPLSNSQSEDQGAFHLRKILVWISENFSWRMEQHFPDFSKKRKTLPVIPKFRKFLFLPGIFVLFEFLPEFSVE